MSSNINWPLVPFLDPTTKRPALPWLLWLQNPSVTSLTTSTPFQATSGGTGVNTVPTNGQVLIGNGTGYSLNTLTAGTGMTITNGAGTITLSNSGISAFSTGDTGLTVSTTNGTATLGGVLNANSGGTGAQNLQGYIFGNGASAMTSVPKIPYADVSGLGTIVTQNLGATGSFSSGSHTLTIVNGIITAIT